MITPARNLILLSAILLGAFPAMAQWTTQTIVLRPGWNAVFLEVQPEPKDCDTLLAGMPVESVWAWNRRFSSVQFIQDPNELVPAQPDWLTYVPPTAPTRSARNLFVLQGGRSYLIKLAPTAGEVSWNILGRPVLCRPDWLADSMNFVGFPLDANSPPTFESFFVASPSQAGQPIYRLDAFGRWERVSSPATTAMKSGEAFWVRCAGPSTYSGPLGAMFEQHNGLDYGRSLLEQTLRLQNKSASTRTFTARVLASASPPNASFPALAGDVPLSYYRFNPANHEVGWAALPTQLSQNNVLPGQDWALRLAVRRIDMAEYAAQPLSPQPLYQSLVEVSDGAGSRLILPVTAQGMKSFGGAGGAGGGGSAPHQYAGLWVGRVVINKVNQPADASPTNPVPTASEFPFRIMIHIDNSGQPSLLQKVLQVWVNGSYTNDANMIQYVAQPGSYHLFTDETSVTNSPPEARRISSAAFGFRNPIPMTVTPTSAAFGSTNTDAAVSCTVMTDFDDPGNPFKHRYHPDHDNLDERYENVLDGKESFKVTRDIRLVFTASDPQGLTLAGWGDSELGGIYTESIDGLHRDKLYLSGTFRLHRTTSVGVLDQ